MSNAAVATDVVQLWRGSNEAFLELLTKVVFCTGFSRSVVERRWHAFDDAFAHFDIATVMMFDENVTEALVSRQSGIIRNARKIAATVANAAVCLALIQDFGSLQKYAEFIQLQNEKDGASQLRKTFRQVGESASLTLYHALRGSVAW